MHNFEAKKEANKGKKEVLKKKSFFFVELRMAEQSGQTSYSLIVSQFKNITDLESFSQNLLLEAQKDRSRAKGVIIEYQFFTILALIVLLASLTKSTYKKRSVRENFRRRVINTSREQVFEVAYQASIEQTGDDAELPPVVLPIQNRLEIENQQAIQAANQTPTRSFVVELQRPEEDVQLQLR